jgi:inosine-uridine nucleoside N-ribohydrolase
MIRIAINFVLLVGSTLSLQSQQQKVWLDSDTGNEMDDLYAIVRLVKDTTVEMVGLSSAHFNNADLLVFENWNGYDTKNLNTVAESQRLNEQILKALNRLDIPHPMGADRQTGRAWGQETPRPSDAAEQMIALARTMPIGQQLHILTLGALTNIASVVQLAPDILPKIKVFSLGAKYEPKTKVWNKSEFNIRNDLNAFDYLLNLERFDFVIMPLEAAFPLKFQREETYSSLDETIEIEKILADRWREHNPQDTQRIMWDLALVEAYLNPEWATVKTVKTPKENKQRKIQVYTKIDEKACAADFWKVLKQ